MYNYIFLWSIAILLTIGSSPGFSADTTLPLIAAPADVNAEAAGQFTSVDLGLPLAKDDSGDAVTVSNSNSGPYALGRHQVIWTAIDSSNNTSTDFQVVVVRDTTPPKVIAPGNVQAISAGARTVVSLGNAIATDLVDGNLNATPDNPGPYTIGQHRIVWAAIDRSGNVGEAEQIVTVTEASSNQAPLVTAPDDITREATGEFTSIQLGQARVVDDQDNALVARADSTGPFTLGERLITWAVTDSRGLIGTDYQRVTIVDLSPPLVTPPPDVSAATEGTRTNVSLGVATAEDRVDGTLTATPNKSGPFTVGPHIVTWSATDRSGNKGVATQLVNVVQTSGSSAPSVSPPASITREATGELTSIALGNASAVDAEDGVLTAIADKSGPFTIGTHYISWSATDSDGNRGIGVQEVRVIDTAPPEVSLAPENKQVKSAGGSVNVDLGSVEGRDLVDGTITGTPDQTGPFPIGVTLVNWSLRDRSGNTANIIQEIEVRSVDDVNRAVPVVTPPPDITTEATGPLTIVALGEVSALDEVEGAITAETVDRGPFEVGTHRVVWRAENAAGKVGLGIQTITILDSTPPQLQIPRDKKILTFNASGPRTIIENPGVSAQDLVDGNIIVTGIAVERAEIGSGEGIAVDISEPILLPSGSYEIFWTATDDSDNSISDQQTVRVIPNVGFSSSRFASAGSTVNISMHLSGKAVEYPVRVPYRIDESSSASGNGVDHDAQHGVVTINSGLTGAFEFKVADNPLLAGIGEATIDFKIETPENALAGSSETVSVTLTTENRQPRVGLKISQNAVPVTTAVKDGGIVTIEASASDIEGGNLSFDWGNTVNELGDINLDDNPATIELDPFNLEEGQYHIEVIVQDDGAPPKSTTATGELIIKKGSALISDSDQDGLSDADDQLETANLLQGKEDSSDFFLLQGEPGVRLKLGPTALDNRLKSARLASSVVRDFPDERSPTTVYDLEVHEFSPGISTYLVLPQATALPRDAAYFLYGRKWASFDEDEDNVLFSAPSSVAGICPQPKHNSYRQGLNPGDRCVQLLIQDGGSNDTDNLENGVIKHLGAIVTGGAEAVESDGEDNVLIVGGIDEGNKKGGGGGSFALWSLFALFMLAFHTRLSRPVFQWRKTENSHL